MEVYMFAVGANFRRLDLSRDRLQEIRRSAIHVDAVLVFI